MQQISKSKWKKLGKKTKCTSSSLIQAVPVTDNKQLALDYLDAIDDPDLMKPILSLALPSKILLFKIMRASVGVTRKQDLWMYVDPLAF